MLKARGLGAGGGRGGASPGSTSIRLHYMYTVTGGVWGLGVDFDAATIMSGLVSCFW